MKATSTEVELRKYSWRRDRPLHDLVEQPIVTDSRGKFGNNQAVRQICQ